MTTPPTHAADPAAATIAAMRASFRSTKALADKAVAQLPFDALRRTLDPTVNSIAVIMKHVAGNLRSRFTDFLDSDGEKPWRHRDEEFVDRYTGRDELMADWESGWAVLFAAIDALAPGDLLRQVTIRGEAQSVVVALARSLAHVSYHVGQIVQDARIEAARDGGPWRTLTIDRGASEAFNQATWGGASPKPTPQ